MARSVQKRERIHPGHYLGTGKIEELKAMLSAYDATGIVCDDELSPAQLQEPGADARYKGDGQNDCDSGYFCGKSLIWRREDSGGAGTAEISPFPTDGDGRIHVSSGRRHWTRGPGEKKLETDRRYIKERIAELNKDGAGNTHTQRAASRAEKQKGDTCDFSGGLY